MTVIAPFVVNSLATSSAPTPTFWEAAADAIIEQRSRQPYVFGAERAVVEEEGQAEEVEKDEEEEGYAHLHHRHHRRHHHRHGTALSSPTVLTPTGGTEDDVSVIDERPFRTAFDGELFEKEHIRPPEIIINSENLSIKSYKSEI
ncbi:hypothetical protein Trydic_g2836 [Trypoxylus dichotomus]